MAQVRTPEHAAVRCADPERVSRYFTPCASTDFVPYVDLVLYLSRDDGMLKGVREKASRLSRLCAFVPPCACSARRSGPYATCPGVCCAGGCRTEQVERKKVLRKHPLRFGGTETCALFRAAAAVLAAAVGPDACVCCTFGTSARRSLSTFVFVRSSPLGAPLLELAMHVPCAWQRSATSTDRALLTSSTSCGMEVSSA
jgi:hypothetical protein